MPQNQGRTDLRPTEERPDVAFMHRPQNAPRTGSSILKSKDTNTNYNKKRTTTPSAIGGDYMDEEMKNQEAAAKSKVRGRQTHLQRDWMNQSVSFDTMVKDILGESALTRTIKTVMNESDDYLEIVASDLYEWLMEVGSNSLLDDFKPQQLKNVIKMKLKKEKFIPNDDTEMANWCRKNEDDIIETVARATGAYFMCREDFLKKQQEEEEIPSVVVKGSEILYNKRGRACGIKIQVIDQGTVYMKRKGSHWEITDISKENDDERVWEMVQSSLEKMAKKNPTTFIRLMRNRAYELPKFKPTTLGESVTVSGMTVAQIQQWLDDKQPKEVMGEAWGVPRGYEDDDYSPSDEWEGGNIAHAVKTPKGIEYLDISSKVMKKLDEMLAKKKTKKTKVQVLKSAFGVKWLAVAIQELMKKDYYPTPDEQKILKYAGVEFTPRPVRRNRPFGFGW